MTDHAGRLDLGRGIDDAPDRALWRQLAPLPSAGFDALKRRAFMTAAVLVEIPIGDAIDRGDDARERSEQGLHRLDRTGDGMRFQADDDKILRPKLGRIVGAAWLNQLFLVADQQFQSVLAHRGEMGAPCDQADVGACAQKLYTEISADRAGAVDADFHWASDCSGYKISAEIKRWLRGSSQNQGGRRLKDGPSCQAAEAGRAAAAAASSHAVLMSRMLMTPIRL